jgi:hypothetical protein
LNYETSALREVVFATKPGITGLKRLLKEKIPLEQYQTAVSAKHKRKIMNFP